MLSVRGWIVLREHWAAGNKFVRCRKVFERRYKRVLHLLRGALPISCWVDRLCALCCWDLRRHIVIDHLGLQRQLRSGQLRSSWLGHMFEVRRRSCIVGWVRLLQQLHRG